jgi:hypothetical protein
MPRYIPALTALSALALMACQADRETFEQGATFETPPAVEEAPASPIPPQPLPPHGSPSGEDLPPLDPDTFTAENIRPADPPPGEFFEN